MNTVAVHHPIFARLYPAMSAAMDRGGIAEHRHALLEDASGVVVEVGAGDGRNFAHYPAGVSRVLAVEPEPHLRRLASSAAARAPVRVEVADGLAEHLPAGDGSADTVVVSLVLCSVRDQAKALGEIRRVLTSSGQLRFLEHVRADTQGMARLQRVLDATIWPRLAGGCRTGRDTIAAIEGAGFSVDKLERFRFPDARIPTSFHIVGTATPTQA
ncbi:methyltransferase domain-containing protein [Actinopolymorpha sp. B11F2]|uniref:class I SAM-dependent methyltransferase n=1 Tax=Actinopolymorpha sp. B11F2 TaxID=3160862 RepID=UPI0032E3852C